ncbi:MAG: tRNA pseudouridine(38-40) synthase TruA [Chloroflexi bacterium]|nr:tRNA pseudouridine(38-40) synthase TruA [Chloroflexota bacterium]
MSYIAARIEYDGTDFAGFQWQKGQRTIQQALEAGLFRLTERNVRVVGSGRTDAGVHGVGQVVAFNLESPWREGLDGLYRALNAVLAEDLAVTGLSFVPAGFHPRFWAVRRTYQYLIHMTRTRPVMARRYVWPIVTPLDIAAMQHAAQVFEGIRDFAALGRAPDGEGHTTVRHVYGVQVLRENPAQSEVRVVVEANAFLFRMVRTIVGLLVQVGLRRITTQDIEKAILRKQRSSVAQLASPAPACGLCLVKVDYPRGTFHWIPT